MLFGNLARFKLALILLLLTTTLAAAEMEKFLGQPLVKEIKLSPDGKYLAVKMFSEDKGHWLRFMDRKTFETPGGFAFDGAREVGEFYWANNERVVFKVYDIAGSVEAPRFYGDLFAVDYDGSNPEAIFGFRTGGQQTGSLIRRKRTSYAWGDIIDPLPNDEDHILISSTPWTDDRDGKATAMLLDVNNGRERNKFKTTMYPFGSFVTDRNGTVRVAKSYKEDQSPHVEFYVDKEDTWVEVEGVPMSKDFSPFAISEDLKSAFVFDHGGEDKLGIYRLTFADSSLSKVYSHEQVDITHAKTTVDGTGVYGMRVDDGQPSYLLFSSDYEEADIFKKFLQTFPGQLVDIISRTEDGSLWIVKTESDIDPGSFYLFDKENNKLALLQKARPNVDSEKMAPMTPVNFQSFDGLEISGYFTKATNQDDDTVAPLIVLVHGGPRARDYWGFNPEVQLLAAKGYSVLQVNYRGSGGYGNAFLHAGDHHWGDHIQQDIIAGTRWAIEEGKAETGKVCIMGASFGAYSALQSAVLAPDLYTCAVANAGIYDLELLYTEGDIESQYIGEEYLDEAVGRNEEELARFSPVNHVENIKASLFIAHGKKDERAPFEHAQALTNALDDHEKDYQFFVKTREAHGFYDTENRIEYYTKALDFLDQHLQ